VRRLGVELDDVADGVRALAVALDVVVRDELARVEQLLARV
jgi:hypothetical protein